MDAAHTTELAAFPLNRYNDARTAHLLDNVDSLVEFARELFNGGTPMARAIKPLYELVDLKMPANAWAEMSPILAAGGYNLNDQAHWYK